MSSFSLTVVTALLLGCCAAWTLPSGTTRQRVPSLRLTKPDNEFKFEPYEGGDSNNPNTFYDLPDYNDILGSSSSDDDDDVFARYSREEAEILEEREDRLYFDNRIKKEKCILVGVEDLSIRRNNNLQGVGSDFMFTLEESMSEMRELIKTAGLECVGEITQRLNQINPKTYVGTGKVGEANELLEQHDCCTVIFDAELTPGQQKALENAFNKNKDIVIQDDFQAQGEIKVLDRTALILDIFAQHAKTKEALLQVDLALHEYRKPRLTRMWTHLERQSGAGGVGLRGPGESQLEIDKRLLRDRIIVLKEKIDQVQKHRTMHRRARERMGLPVLSLIGYTNAGKSSLLNYLTKAGVMAESMLFATLDPTTRKVKLPGYKTHPEVLLTDTVGFIQKLPTNLVAAFRATLEEVQEADVLVHVMDVSNPSWEKQEQAVLATLDQIGTPKHKPIVRVWNKIDLLDSIEAEHFKFRAIQDDKTVAISALQGDNMQDLVAVIEEALSELLVSVELVLPYNKGDELNAVHEQGNVETIEYREDGTYVQALVPQAIANRLIKYRVDDYSSNVQPLPLSPSVGPISDENEEEIDWAAIGRGRHTAR